MSKFISLFGFVIFLTLAMFSSAFPQATTEQLVISTYYPSPYGSYADLTANRMKIGTSYSTTVYNFVTDGLIVEGRVGIGTATPGYALDVVGDINVDSASDIRKNGGAYANPDYVFEPGYSLLSIDVLRQFIREKKHLPNLPSTTEVKKEGVKMFEQNRLMLEKLEEAYLYIFTLEDRISKLEKAAAAK